MVVRRLVSDIELIPSRQDIFKRLLRTFVGVLPCSLRKNSCAHHFKGKHGKLYIVGNVNKM